MLKLKTNIVITTKTNRVSDIMKSFEGWQISLSERYKTHNSQVPGKKIKIKKEKPT